MDFDFGRAATDLARTENGFTVTTETEDSETVEYETDRVLVAIWREPVTDTLDLSNAGIGMIKRSFISTEKTAR